ncbi:MAG: bacterial Ig-like domain-containing protein, partial [Clostridiales bacterium]|nr:bacterial Ig-like domain-containing protein [Clostridiales bacterium]
MCRASWRAASGTHSRMGATSATGSDGSILRRTALQVRGSVDMDTAGVYQVYLTYRGEDYQGTTLLLVVVE